MALRGPLVRPAVPAAVRGPRDARCRPPERPGRSSVNERRGARPGRVRRPGTRSSSAGPGLRRRRASVAGRPDARLAGVGPARTCRGTRRGCGSAAVARRRLARRGPHAWPAAPASRVIQPAWSPAGVLHVVSDETGWWNLYAFDGPDGPRGPGPQPRARWTPSWAIRPGSSGGRRTRSSPTARSSRSRARDGARRAPAHRAGRDGHAGSTRRSRSSRGCGVAGGTAVAVVAGPHDGAVRPAPGRRDGRAIRGARALARPCPLDAVVLPAAEPITFPTADGATRPGALLRPVQRRASAGPTASCRRSSCSRTAGRPAPRRRRSRWTARSSPRAASPWSTWTTAARPATGGRTATRCKGQWGIADVEDCIAAARFLVERGSVDPARLAIRGGSAGGYTTLAALTFRPEVFAAGISHYGIADLELIHCDGHKFESRYDEGLVAPWTDDGPEGVPGALADPLPRPRPGADAASSRASTTGSCRRPSWTRWSTRSRPAACRTSR